MQHLTSRAAAKTARAVAILTAVCLMFLCLPARAAEALMTPIIEDISPKTAMTLTTGSTRTIEVLASRDADLTVTVGKTEIEMSRTGSTSDSGLYWYEGSYTAPSSAAGTTVSISATATFNGRSQTRNGGAFKVVAMENSYDGSSGTVEGDMLVIENAQSFSGQQITVTDSYADVFIPAESDRNEDYAAPYYYQLPEGTIDYVSSGPDANNIYWLKSGRKVSANDVEVSANSGS